MRATSLLNSGADMEASVGGKVCYSHTMYIVCWYPVYDIGEYISNITL